MLGFINLLCCLVFTQQMLIFLPLADFQRSILLPVFLIYLKKQHSLSTPISLLPGCSRHMLLAIGLVGRAGGHHRLLEARPIPLHHATHVPLHHIGAPVPVDGGIQKLEILLKESNIISTTCVRYFY